MANQVGWIGLGRMGEAMVKRLLKAGLRRAACGTARAARPSRWPSTAPRSRATRSTSRRCEVVFTMVSTTDDLKEVLFGDGGLVTGASEAAGWWSTAPRSRRRARPRSARGSKALGVAYLCAPVSGNAKVAKAGKLLIVASGPKALYDKAAALPAGHGPQGHVGGRGRAGAHLEDRAQHHVRRRHPEPVRDHRAGREGRHPAPRVPGEHQRLGAGLHVHALQDADAVPT